MPSVADGVTQPFSQVEIAIQPARSIAYNEADRVCRKKLIERLIY